MMKNLFRNMTWGKSDSNTLKHALLGLVLLAVFVAANYLLTPEQSALLSVFAVSCVWEYQQYLLKQKPFDLKDITASCITGILLVIALFIKH